MQRDQRGSGSMALHSLPAEMRQVILMKEYEEQSSMKFTEIPDTCSTVKSRLTRVFNRCGRDWNMCATPLIQ
jgi:DNA-directed RNA polymerase specialized sigma24 family protein